MFPTLSWPWFALGSALFAALTAILAKVGVAGISSNLATLIRTAVILAFAGGIVTVRGEWSSAGLSPRTLLFLVLSGLATGLSWLCYFRALQLAPASRVAPVDKLSVVLVVLFAGLFLQEPMTPRVLGGASLIAIGSLLLLK